MCLYRLYLKFDVCVCIVCTSGLMCVPVSSILEVLMCVSILEV